MTRLPQEEKLLVNNEKKSLFDFIEILDDDSSLDVRISCSDRESSEDGEKCESCTM